MGLPHYTSLDPDNISFAGIYGFHGYEILSTEIGPFSYAALASCSKLFAKFPTYYEYDCRYNLGMSEKYSRPGMRDYANLGNNYH